MFNSLDEEIDTTVGRPKRSEHLARLAGIVVLSAVIFGGLCALIVALE
jgi:hypothetical protein